MSRFLNLPAELRLEIYRDVFVQEGAIPVEESVHIPSRPLSAVCKQIKHEAEPVFWGENTFHAIAEDADLTPAVEWLSTIGKKKASLISTFVVEYKHSEKAPYSIGFRVIYWHPEKYRVMTPHRGWWPQIHRQYNDEMTCQLEFLVDQVQQLFALGLPKSSIKPVEDAKAPPLGPNEKWRRSHHANKIMVGMHLAFNKKMLQLSRSTYFHEEEETLVQVGGWSIMLVFEREQIPGRIPQSSYRNRSKMVLDRASSSRLGYWGGTWRSSDAHF